MGTQIEVSKTGYRIYSTISDGFWFEEPKPRNETLKVLDDKYYRDYQLKMIELHMTFPNGFSSTKGNYIQDPSFPKTSYLEWHISVLNKDEYEDLVEAKYDEVMGLIYKDSEG